MSGTPVPGSGSGIDKSQTPKTPNGGRKLVQGRLPFAAVDNKTPVVKANNNESKEEEKTPAKVTNPVKETPVKSLKGKEVENEDEEVYRLDDSPKSVSLPVESDLSDSSHSLIELSGRDSCEMNTSRTSLEDSSKITTPKMKKKATPKVCSASRTAEREKKRLEKLKEKEEREKKKMLEKAEKDRIKKEKEEEKEAEKRRKEEEKRKKEEEREADKKRKEDEKRRKEEEKEAEKKRKEEEKRRKEEEKEAEKKKKEEDERKKKERLSQVFTNFFTQKKTTPAKTDGQVNTTNAVSLAFPPFQVKDNMRLASTFRTNFDEARRAYLDRCIDEPPEDAKEEEISCKQFKGRTRKSGPTWPLSKEADVEVIDEDDTPDNKEDVIITVPAVPRRMRAKLLKFDENRRPAYWGTWRKTSQSVGPRRPFGKEPIMDYEVDSDDEWEEEVEPGESLTDSEGEGEEKEPADDYEVDNEFLVPHGYLSDEEGEKDEDERPLSPTAAKEQLKLKEEQFERELKEKTCHIKPSLIGCCWETTEENGQRPEAQLLKVLQRYGAVLLTAAAFPVIVQPSEMQMCTDGNGDSPSLLDESGVGRGEKTAPASKRLVSEVDMPALVRLLHGALHSKSTIVSEFLAYLERTRREDKNVPSKLQILAKIGEIASWSKCTEAGTMSGRTCWVVQPDVLERYQLSDLSAVNTWEFVTTEGNKKRARNKQTEESATGSKDNANKPGDEEVCTPPAKTARISLMKKFVQPVTNSPTSAEGQLTKRENSEKPEQPPTSNSSNTSKAKKRIALISVSPSVSKKSKTEPSKTTPLTSFLKKMSTPKQSRSPKPSDNDVVETECVELE